MTAHVEPALVPALAIEKPRRQRPQWRRAWRALQRLLEDPDATANAFGVVDALDPEWGERGLRIMLGYAEGRRLFVEQPSLLDRLADREGLLALPEGSLGRAYLAHIERFGLEPSKLVALRRETDVRWESRDSGLRWFVDRYELMHDLWHALTGYGADGLGEAALLPFSLAQKSGLGGAFLTVGAAVRARRAAGRGWFRYLWRAWRRGRRAVCLLVVPYEELLPLPLDEVRRLLRITPPELAHPDGVRVS